MGYIIYRANEVQLSHWEKFANQLLHQGGLLYVFESALRQKMCLLPNNVKAYIPNNEKTKKVRISFDGRFLKIKE